MSESIGTNRLNCLLAFLRHQFSSIAWQELCLSALGQPLLHCNFSVLQSLLLAMTNHDQYNKLNLWSSLSGDQCWQIACPQDSFRSTVQAKLLYCTPRALLTILRLSKGDRSRCIEVSATPEVRSPWLACLVLCLKSFQLVQKRQFHA